MRRPGVFAPIEDEYDPCKPLRISARHDPCTHTDRCAKGLACAASRHFVVARGRWRHARRQPRAIDRLDVFKRPFKRAA